MKPKFKCIACKHSEKYLTNKHIRYYCHTKDRFISNNKLDKPIECAGGEYEEG